MKKNILIISLLLLIYSCSNSKSKYENDPHITNISIDVSAIPEVNLADIFKKIDLIPLETKKESLIGNVDQLIYVKDSCYIIRDGDRNVLTFDKDGKFIANSVSVRGNGPGEYAFVLSAIYNPFTKMIDILQPFNKVSSYTVSFHFVNEKKINYDGENYGFFHHVFPISESEYICLYPTIYDEYNTLFFYDSKEGKMIEKIIFDDIYGYLTQTVNPVKYTDSYYYFTPALTTYTGYSIDIDKRTVNPEVYLDFGKQRINQKETKQSDANGKIQNQLLQSRFPIPVANLFNKNYLICRIFMSEKVEIHTLFCNLITEKKYLIREKTEDNYLIPFFYLLEDTELYAAIFPYQISEYIDPNLLSDKAKDYISKIEEDDNPIIVKYSLK